MRTTISHDKLRIILRLAKRVSQIPGYFAECGVFEGFTLKAMAIAFPERTVLGFDTFNGLPADCWQEDEPHRPGEFSPTSFDQVHSETHDVPNLRLVAGLFPDSADKFKNSNFAFVHLDFDFYQSTKLALEWLLPRMSIGGVIVFDDYDWPSCPGVRRTIDELSLDVLVAGHQAIYTREVTQ